MNGTNLDFENALPTGKWAGFYLETYRAGRGWMNMYLEFSREPNSDIGSVRGEGTDYVGPWTLVGQFDLSSARCSWSKSYVGKHIVEYDGNVGADGIKGHWRIGEYLTGDFHIWPEFRSDIHESYLHADLEFEQSSHLGTVPLRGKDDAI